MPHCRVNGATLYYEEHGTGPETLVFAHGLLLSGRMFEAQVQALREEYRCITFDFRGQGWSEVTASGYDMDTLTEDAAALVRELDAAPCHFIGLSMGGFVGMRLAIRYPELIRSLILLNTSADPEPRENIRRYRMLNVIALLFGFGLVAPTVMPILFGQKFLTDPARTPEQELWRERLLKNNRRGIFRAVKGVISRQGIADQLPRIRVPTLILAGEQDVATPPMKSQEIHERIMGSQLVVIPGAGHSSPIEEPEAVTKAIKDFLRRDLPASAVSSR
ncbi:MAG TPA: alpha/beta fold hydrolase [Blastocatellia bacterium]|nr:alpha/beta fold hydrolase [Blastocatellia bacterium]